MKKLTKKLRSRRGETFVEVLVAMLVVVLASMLMAVMYSASQGINTTAREKDKEFYEAVGSVETGGATDSGLGTVTLTEVGSSEKITIDVTVYTEAGLTAYGEATP